MPHEGIEMRLVLRRCLFTLGSDLGIGGGLRVALEFFNQKLFAIQLVFERFQLFGCKLFRNNQLLL